MGSVVGGARARAAQETADTKATVRVQRVWGRVLAL